MTPPPSLFILLLFSCEYPFTLISASFIQFFRQVSAKPRKYGFSSSHWSCRNLIFSIFLTKGPFPVRFWIFAIWKLGGWVGTWNFEEVFMWKLGGWKVP